MNHDPEHLSQLCANVQGNFLRLAAFAEEHDISFALACFYVLVGSMNIRIVAGAGSIFEPVSPASIAKAARMEPKTVSRWCTQLTACGLMRRHRGAYAIEEMAQWYVLANCMQKPAISPVLATAGFNTIAQPTPTPVPPVFTQWEQVAVPARSFSQREKVAGNTAG